MLVTVATCNLNQWALDFDGNRDRIVESIHEARKQGAKYRLGPELEICGYGCEDHFYEHDTFLHSMHVLREILVSGCTDGILCDIGMPVIHMGVRYNCRVFCLDGRILLIRPKMHLASDGNYREERWFTAWPRTRAMESHVLPAPLREVTGQRSVPFGFAYLQLNDTALAAESCEELWVPDSPHTHLCLNGVEIISNASGSHHQLRKLDRRLDLVMAATAKNGGVYMYANQQGCDGGRLYFDGSSCVSLNGKLLVQGSQFSVKDVEVVTAVVDLEDVRSFRSAIVSRSVQAAQAPRLPSVEVDFSLSAPVDEVGVSPTAPIEPRYHRPEEEIGLGPACWLWDYLRRSRAAGFFLPLSGGADSSAVATIVGIMCHLVAAEARAGNARVIQDAREMVREASFDPSDPRELANRIFHTCYMGAQASSRETFNRAKTLASETGAYHSHITIDTIVDAVCKVVQGALCLSAPLRYINQGGTWAEDVALQNVQARLRMVCAYTMGQLLPLARGRRGWLLVLGSANVDEALRGYMTKYDCSSADLNPIGAVSKVDLRAFLRWAAHAYPFPSLEAVVSARPTAELRPMVAASGGAGAGAGDGAATSAAAEAQDDEEEMGMTYEELSWFGRLRKIHHCGPVTMFLKLCSLWSGRRPTDVASKVKHFFKYYAINRHKMTTITPAYHAENYSPDDNRYDHRQFLYNVEWTAQFREIDRVAAEMEARAAAAPREAPSANL